MDQALIARLQALPLFGSLEVSRLDEFGEDLELVLLAAGDVLFSEGEQADALFVVAEGALEVCVAVGDGSMYVLGEMGAGEVVGEIALLTAELRSATIRAATDAVLVRMGGDAFLRFLGEHTEIAQQLVDRAADRLRRTQLTAQVVRHLGVEDLSALREIEQHLEWVQLAAGDWLFRESDPADAAYLVATGRLRVVHGADEVPIAEIGRGELVGEMALLEGGTRNAGIYAIRDSQLVRLPANIVALLLDRFPQVFLHLTKTILQRVRVAASRRVAEDQLSIAVVATSARVDVHGFARDLTTALQGAGSTAHLWSDHVDAMLGRPGIAQSGPHEATEIRLGQWLHEAEDRSRFLVLECDRSATPWSERVVRQCDHVLYVADATGSKTVGEVEQVVSSALRSRRHPRSSLVLLHPSSTSLPRATAAWLSIRAVDDAFHVRDDASTDLDRLARVLAGRAVSLVLSGGGARGYAHIGVIRAMRELGIPIDYIAGTSIGSVIASLPPMGLSDSEIVPAVEERFRDIMDWTLPVVSVVSGKRISSSIVKHYQDIDIEDLWYPYFCVSASLTRAREVIHRRGRLAVAVRASVAIPGVLPPVPVGDELLVDGGVIDNLPVPEARRDNPNGPVIAVDVAPPSGPRARSDYGMWMSGWTALGTTLRPRRRKGVPMLHGTVLGSMLIASTRDRDRVVKDGLADLYLPIDARGCGPFEWSGVQKVADVGYDATIETLANWAETIQTPWVLR
jgi:predicted acylesterase/phospholipase RssA/CRP-like cAMP-binding protein